jgi:DHA2 family multidrug resistance protein
MASKAIPSLSSMTWNQKLIAGFCLAMGNFMVFLDMTIANVSVPHIAGDLGVTLEQGTWVISSYAVAEAICVPLSGWLAQRFGEVRLFISGLAGFTFFSFLCGSSVTLEMLVVCRIGQGLCGAPLMPMSQTLMLRIFPGEQRAAAMAVWATTITLAPALGPIIGGLISDGLGWHWVFLINLPIGAALLVASMILLRRVESTTRIVPIDRVGLVLLIFWVACLQIMLDTGRDRDWFGDPLIVMLAIGSSLGLAVFVIWELTEEHPIVDLRIMRNRGFAFTTITMGIAFSAFFSGIVMVPQWLQSSLGYSATSAGLVTSAHAYASLAMTPIVVRLMRTHDPRHLVAFGLSVMAASALMRAGWTSTGGFWDYYIPMFLQGFGVAFMAISLTTLSLQSVAPKDTASAAGLQNFVRTMAMAMAAAGTMSFWTDSQRVARTEIVDKLSPQQAETALQNTGYSLDQTRRTIEAMVDREALTLAVDEVFLIAALMLFLASVLVLMAPKPRAAPGAPPIAGH